MRGLIGALTPSNPASPRMSRYPIFRLGDVADVAAGDPAPQDSEAFALDGPLFVRMHDVGRDHLNPALRSSRDRLDPHWIRENRLRLFPRGSTLIPKSGASVNLNHRAKLDVDAYVVSHLAVVIPDRSRVHPDYLYWWSVHYDPRDQVRVTSLPSLKLSTLRGAGIPIPSLDEQRRIVRILNRAARIERLRAEARESLISFSAALFIEMFGNPSENPMGWEIMRLGSICRIVGGGTPRRGNDAYFGGDILWATPTDVTALNGILIDKTAETITDVGLKESSARLVPAGSVLMTSRATIGYTAIAARPMATNQGFANLICGDLLSPEYISSLLRNRREELIDLAAGTTFKEIPKSTLKNFRVPVPPLETQNKFKAILHRATHAQMKDRASAEIVSALNWSLMAYLLEDSP